jgi:hypothetical protein
MLTTLLVTRQIVAIASAVIKPRATSWLKAHFLARKLQKQSLLKTGKGCREAVCRRGEQACDSINKQAIIQQMNTEVSSSSNLFMQYTANFMHITRVTCTSKLCTVSQYCCNALLLKYTSSCNVCC